MINNIINYNGYPCFLLKKHKRIEWCPNLDDKIGCGIIFEILFKNESIFLDEQFDLLVQGNIEHVHPKSKIIGFEEIRNGRKSGNSYIYCKNISHRHRFHFENFCKNTYGEFWINGEPFQSKKRYEIALNEFLINYKNNPNLFDIA